MRKPAPEVSVKIKSLQTYGRQDRLNISVDHSVNMADHFITFTGIEETLILSKRLLSHLYRLYMCHKQ